ncbi:MAG: cyclopropane-fatty-acyl-phospholipid synthase family protein [Alphaproteobacteria bacterium]|uniref:SAM-dependent methyltransferase n=1 Tax=Brevundimonas sp. TaxID=1871086 RepID=UPI0025BD5251|nr:cyclopropane-fatty-acyl-phospholipid synthase family protein [Brevundimonas sp.]MBU4196540.1 cyclopropane-fatty-acyl-phospholipid synthase family protein [Alphaproteobacteria bacterium]MBU4238780.1 cyclopropane-fatty-acyl-phospholipid synthase family protein [Alphaproteobacteria bacterium]MCG2661879.1 cyclopropane-fatty-acyl-phospholipid synthase family protein [Brevundimonas sp.]
MTTVATGGQDSRTAAARRIVAHIAGHLQTDLSLQLWTGEVLPLGPGARDDIRIVLSDPSAVRRLVLKPGLMTLFELYATGDVRIEGGSPLEAADRWDHGRAVHLPRRVNKGLIARALIPFLLAGRARSVGDAAYDPTGEAGQRQDKSARTDKDFIAFHYDVGNDFYGLFLDPEMVYSSACYADADQSLEDAQTRKLDLICRKLRLKPGQTLLDIGCGWGGLSCWAARHYGVKVHGVTLSEEQLAFANAKIARLGLQDRITLELKDYRDLEMTGRFDAISQVEMFEHVGFANHDRHFLEMHRLLKPGGLYFHQASVRRGGRDIGNITPQTTATRTIGRFIFPGGEMDTIGMTVTNLGRLGFEVLDVENLREHFQATTAEWSRRLMARRDEAIAMVGEERTRLWLIFFAMCAKGFERGSILVYQTVAQKRRAGKSGLPLDRASLYR